MDKAVALLSGGIDSPVAIHNLSDRLQITAVHFHQQGLTDGSEIDKVRDLSAILHVSKFIIVPFADVFTTLATLCSHRDYYILGKIAMLRCAELIAQQENAGFLVTGENLGQVSSQTLSNLATITSSVSMPILRPLLVYDKQEIIAIAQRIGTFDISKGPEICCLLGPKNPATKSSKKRIDCELAKINLSPLLAAAIRNMQRFCTLS